MIKYYAQDDLRMLAIGAANCILRNMHMPITLRGGEQPKGFPLPVARARGEGDITQDYRPLAILEFVQDAVREEASQKAAADKKAAEAQAVQ